MKKQLLTALLPFTLAAAMIPASAMATCSMVGGIGYVDFSFSSISAPDSAAIGSVLAEQQVTFEHPGTDDGSFHCDGNGGTVYGWTNQNGTVYGPPVSGLAHTYATNIPGIGFQVVEENPSQIQRHYDNPAYILNHSANAGYGFAHVVFTLKIVKTAQTTKGGVLASGEVANFMLDSGQKDMAIRLNGGTIVTSSN